MDELRAVLAAGEPSIPVSIPERLTMNSISRLLACLALIALPLACNGDPTSRPTATGSMVVQITDAPLYRNLIAQASIDVTAVKVHHSANGDSGFVTLYSGAPITIDLLGLNYAVIQQLADAELPIGTYHQVRLIVSSARLELTNGNVYSTAASNLQLTSLDTSGLKINIEPKIEVFRG